VQGPGYNYYLLNGVGGYPYDGALMYPMDNYFNLIGTGPDPLQGPIGISATALITSRSTMGYVAPYNGEVVSVNVNSAFVDNSSFQDAGFDFFIINSGGIITVGDTFWSALYSSGRYMSGFSQTFNGTASFNAGDLIFCYVGDYTATFSIPIAPVNGEFNVTLYVRYYP
jgi:hypothetical protein